MQTLYSFNAIYKGYIKEIFWSKEAIRQLPAVYGDPVCSIRVMQNPYRYDTPKPL